MILAIDPGKDKCGLAVLDTNGYVLDRQIFSRTEVSVLIPKYVAKYGVSALVVGQSFCLRKILNP